MTCDILNLSLNITNFCGNNINNVYENYNCIHDISSLDLLIELENVINFCYQLNNH
jgi:hypothetical protein